MREPGGGARHVAGVIGPAHVHESVVRRQDRADDPEARRRGRGELLERRGGVRDEAVLQQQVLGRVPDQAELGGRDEVAALLGTLAERVENLLGIAVEVPDR